MPGRLDGKVALITGGARGIGEAQVRRFVAEGAQVAFSDVLTAEGESLAKELGSAVRFMEHDVGDEARWAAVVDETTGAFGRLDILVNTAGIAAFHHIADLPVEEYLRVFHVNQLGVFLGMRAVIPAMRVSGGGAIVNVSSINGLAGAELTCAYTATKYAVTGMTKAAALDLAPDGIRVNSIHPGTIRTPILAVAPGIDVGDVVGPTVPLRRLGQADEVAAMTLFLASDESSYCTGAQFVVDGGVLAGHRTYVDERAFR